MIPGTVGIQKSRNVDRVSKIAAAEHGQSSRTVNLIVSGDVIQDSQSAFVTLRLQLIGELQIFARFVERNRREA